MTPIGSVRWLHGSPDCANSLDPLLQVHEADPDTFILRIGKCFSFEANFVYLLVGRDRAILFDTGGPPDPTSKERVLPLRATVDAILDAHPHNASDARIALVVAHTHAHRDHVHWDHQFVDRPRTALVGHGLREVSAFYGLPEWPDGASTFDLGGRVLTIFPIPGHEVSHVAVHDARTGILLTGDTLYPGLLTVRDWPAFRRSARRLAEFARSVHISQVLGNHVEMSRTPGVLYPLGSVYQPDEHPLPLSVEHIAELHEVCEAMARAPRDVVRASFAIKLMAG